MRKVLLFLWISGVCCFAGSGSETPIAVFVIDTSPTSHWSEVRRAGESLLNALDAEWQVKVYSVRGSRCHKLLDMPHGPEAKQAFSRELRQISADWFAHANLERAFKETIYPNLLEQSTPDTRAVLIILSDGTLRSNQDSHLARLAWEFKVDHNWPMIVTGRPKNTANAILVAATQDKLYWLSLLEARHTAAVRELLDNLLSEPAADDVAVEPEISTYDTGFPMTGFDFYQYPESREPVESELYQTRDELSRNHVHAPINDTETIVAEPPDDTAAVESVELDEIDTDLIEPSLGLESVTQAQNSEIEMTAEPEVLKAEPENQEEILEDDPESQEEDVFSSVYKVTAYEHDGKLYRREDLVGRDVLVKRHDTEPITPMYRDTAQRPKRSVRPSILLAVGALSGVSGVVVLLSVSLIRAKQWQNKARQKLSQATQASGRFKSILVARTQGRQYPLGDLSLFKCAYVGKNTRNPIQVSGEGISDRHLKLTSKGKKLYACNLSAKTIRVHASTLQPGSRMRLTVPANIHLTDQVCLQLLILYEKLKSGDQKNVQHTASQ